MPVPYTIHNSIIAGAFADPSLQFKEMERIAWPLFRYTDRRWFDLLKEEGQLFLRPLLYYQDAETLGHEVGDDKEGFRGFNEVLNGGPVAVMAVATNGWVLCMSHERDDRNFETFGDTCFSINSIEFFLEISRALHARSDSGVLWQVEYLDDKGFIELAMKREAACDWAPDMAFIKRPAYAAQAEVRAVWWPRGAAWGSAKDPLAGHWGRFAKMIDDPQFAADRPGLFAHLQPISIHVPKASQYVSLVEHRPKQG